MRATHGDAVELGVADLLVDDVANLLVLVVVVVDRLSARGEQLDRAVQSCREMSRYQVKIKGEPKEGTNFIHRGEVKRAN